jgi:hypothetical protein
MQGNRGQIRQQTLVWLCNQPSCNESYIHMYIHKGKVTILWNQKVWTDRNIPNNKLDKIIHNKQETCMVIVVAIPGDRNVIQRENFKI